MSDRVELPLTCSNLLQVERCVQDAVRIPQRLGARHVVAGRVYHAAAAAVDHLGQARDLGGCAKVCRVVVAHDVRCAVYHVAAALDCDVLHRGLPLRVAVGVGREVDADALLVQCRACERHEVLPADERAHGTPRRLAHGEVVVLRVAPYQALGTGWLELAVPCVKVTVWRKYQVGVVERARGGVALGDADAHPRPRALGSVRDGLALRAADDHGAVVVALPELAAAGLARTDDEAEREAVRVAGNEQFGQDDEVAWVLLGDALDGVDCAGEAGVAVERLRARLDDGDLAGVLQVFHAGLLCRWWVASVRGVPVALDEREKHVRRDAGDAAPQHGARAPRHEHDDAGGDYGHEAVPDACIEHGGGEQVVCDERGECRRRDVAEGLRHARRERASAERERRQHAARQDERERGQPQDQELGLGHRGPSFSPVGAFAAAAGRSWLRSWRLWRPRRAWGSAPAARPAATPTSAATGTATPAAPAHLHAATVSAAAAAAAAVGRVCGCAHSR